MTSRASIDQIKQRKGQQRREIHKLLKDAAEAHQQGLTEEAPAARYDALMARFQEIEERKA